MSRLPLLSRLVLTPIALLLWCAAAAAEPATPAPLQPVASGGETAASPPAGAPVAPAPGAASPISVSPASSDGSAAEAAAPGLAEATEEAPVAVAATLFPGPPADDAGPLVTEQDLSPIFTAEPARTAKARFDAGRYREAAALLDPEGASTPAVRFLRALALHRGQRFEEAGEAFAALAPDYPVLADRCYHLAGVAFEAAGDLQAAAGALGAVDEGSLDYLEAQRALARVLARQGDLSGARAVLAPLAARPTPASPSWDPRGEALFDLARLEEAQGEGRAAAASYLEVWSEHAAIAHASPALERAQALGAAPDPRQKIRRGELLMEAHRSAQAVELLQPLIEAPPRGLEEGWLCRARLAHGKALRKLHQHARAAAALQVAVESCPKDDLWARALFLAGGSAAIVDPELGARLYRRLAEEMPEHFLADDALLGQADLLARAGRRGPARAALERVARLYPEADTWADALFALFWLERADGRLERALRALERLKRSERPPDAASLERALYWRARTLADLGRKEAARAQYEALGRDFPAGYYALLSRARLQDLAPDRAPSPAALLPAPPAGPEPLRAPLGALRGSPRLASALELLRLGLPELAQEELLAVDRAALRSEPSPHALRLLVLLLARAGDARVAHAVARTELRADLGAPIRPETLPLWRVAFPLAFREPIARRSQEAGIDPDLLQALIREESALDPKVHSWAGAVGLCQLMPFTAREVAAWLKLPGVGVADLHEPDLNIRLGATYLSRLLKRFGNNLALSLAAYNAGGGAVNGWLRQSSARELDEFVEEIPVAETRNYVKKVLRSYAAYQLLYGRPERAPMVAAHLLAAR